MPVNLLGWYPDYLDSDNYLNPFAHSPASWSGSFYDNPDMDALLDAQASAQDEGERIALLGDVQDLWVTESPFVPIGQGSLFVAYNDGISNVVLDPLALFHYFLIEKE
jgi:peptide/nickel transport system substrate-binding protein